MGEVERAEGCACSKVDVVIAQALVNVISRLANALHKGDIERVVQKGSNLMMN